MIDQANSRIRFRMLRYFQVLADEMHFGRAAARLNISQPPLSMQIKELEEILEVALFERTSRKVALTRAGKVLKTEVDRILSATDQSLNYVRQIGRSEHQHITIGIVGSALWGTLLTRLKDCRKTLPGLEWSLLELSQHQQIEALRTRTIDVAINRNVIPTPEANIRCQLISRESMLVAVSEGDPLCDEAQVTLAMLAARPFISLSFSQSDFAQQLYDRCVEAGFYPLIAHQVYEPQTALALVSAGMGVSLLPETSALIHWPGVVFLPLAESIPADLYALWVDEPLSSLMSRFLAALHGSV
ncbi:LysR family transcriptional regulator [Trabulsiella odontotermitis]|uniref:LysR family transcriptional regulator n=1 Tax=Trabulsiella odontotermitis TaxID=379893 RepID=UPI003ACBE075